MDAKSQGMNAYSQRSPSSSSHAGNRRAATQSASLENAANCSSKPVARARTPAPTLSDVIFGISYSPAELACCCSQDASLGPCWDLRSAQ